MFFWFSLVLYLATVPLSTANDADAVFIVHNVTRYIPGSTGDPDVLLTSVLAYPNRTAADAALADITACGNFVQTIPDVCNTIHNPCDPNAVCTSPAASLAQCQCNVGFNLTSSTTVYPPHNLIPRGTNCPDINECDTVTCHAQANCTNTVGSFVCTCHPGYSGDGTSCTDIDECAQTPSPCDSNAECTNQAGEFSCSCNTGFTGNGLSCSDINECEADNPCPTLEHVCSNTAGSFNCGCPGNLVNLGSVCQTPAPTTVPTTTTPGSDSTSLHSATFWINVLIPLVASFLWC